MLDFILDRKKLICLILFIVVMSTSLCGCNKLNGKEPYNYPNSLWVCDEPRITLKVDSINHLKAWLGDEGSSQEFILAFGYGGNIDAYRADAQTLSSDSILFQGYYSSYEDHLVIFVENDTLWNNQYSVLYFEKIE